MNEAHLQRESDLRTKTLSPVSPKPIYLPTPSNIPILANQMDPTLSETSTFSATGTQGQPYSPNDAPQLLSEAQPETLESQVADVPQQDASSLALDAEGDEAEPQNASDAPPEQSAPSQDAEPASAIPAEPLVQDAPAQPAPIDENASSGDATAQDYQALSEPVDIQALLANIVNSSAHVPALTAVEQPPATFDGAQDAVESQAPTTGDVSYMQEDIAESSEVNGAANPSDNLAGIADYIPLNGQPTSADATQAQNANDEQEDENDLGGEDRRWSPETQAKYDQFLEEERGYVAKGEWDKFPTNSRLFIGKVSKVMAHTGNLSTERVTKRDLFHVFHHYGKLAQVSIKQAYGFVQFLETEPCMRSLDAEQGTNIRGKKIHLEISKPQKSRGGRERRRSRSPDRRGDRYRGGDRDRRRRRSPSPRRRRSPDNYRRSRSRSPYGRHRRSPSPRRGLDDDCPLPRRAPQDVPDVQIIAKDDPDRNFIGFVEKAFQARGVRANVLLLHPRLSEESVMRRQIIEGVMAVMKLDRTVQITQRFSLSVFDRSAGHDNVRFEEYANLELNVCVELVIRAKSTAKPPAPAYGGYATGPYGLPMAPAQPQQPPSQPPGQFYGAQPSPGFGMDPNALQSLLSRSHTTPSQQYGQAPAPASDLSRLLATAGGGAAAQHAQQANPFAQPQQPHVQSAAALGHLAGLLGQPGGGQQPGYAPPGAGSPYHQQGMGGAGGQGPVDMKNIMAGLAKWKG